MIINCTQTTDKEVANKIAKEANEQNMDIYNVVAFRCYEWWTNDRNLCCCASPLFEAFIKALIVATLQIMGTIFIVDFEVNISSDVIDWDKTKLHALQFFVSAYVSSRWLNMLKALDDVGMYCIINHSRAAGKNKFSPIVLHGITYWILCLGLYVNYFVFIMVTLVSYYVIFKSQSPFDIVLNSMALFWIVDADNEVVSNKDCIEIEEYYKRYNTSQPRQEIGLCWNFIAKGCYYLCSVVMIVMYFIVILASPVLTALVSREVILCDDCFDCTC